jgi:hypothetical protein
MIQTKTILLAVLGLLLTSCLTTTTPKPPAHQPVDKPFESDIHDTITRLSAKLPAASVRSGANQNTVHVRRDFQVYKSKIAERRDIDAERSEIISECCSNGTIKAAIYGGTDFHFDYYAKNGLHIASTVVDHTACQKELLTEAYGKVNERDGVYVIYENGIVKDTRNHLEWLAGPDNNVTWYEADNWVKGLGGDWRMPTLKELETLYQKGAGTRNMTPLLKTSGWWVWSGETVGKKEARSFCFGQGFKGWIFKSNSASERAFAVRSKSR